MYVKVRVIAGAKKELFEKIAADAFKIAVREEAQQNLANKRVIALCAQHFGVSAGKVRIVSGHHSPSKILSIETGK